MIGDTINTKELTGKKSSVNFYNAAIIISLMLLREKNESSAGRTGKKIWVRVKVTRIMC